MGSVDLKCMWEPHSYWKIATREASKLCSISNILLFLEVNFIKIKASVMLFAFCDFHIAIS